MSEFKERFWLPRAHAVNTLIERAKNEGTIRTDLDTELTAEMLYAPLYFRLLFQIEPLDAATTEAFLNANLTGIGA